jgi:hypothetical protein
VLVTTSTSAPVHAVALGLHRIGGSVDATLLPITALNAVAVDTSSPPSGVGATPLLVRGPRSGGRTPLMLWFTRPVAANASTVTLQLVDPLVRVTTQTVTVPGWVAPQPPSLQIISTRTIAGRGTVFTVESDAPIDGAFEMRVAATPLLLPWRRGFGSPFVFPPLRPRTVRATWLLANIDASARPFRLVDVLAVRRESSISPFRYQLFVGFQPQFQVTITVNEPGGPVAQVSTTIR